MARPKKDNHPISIRMDETVFARLSAFCEVSGQSKTVAIERAVCAYLDANEGRFNDCCIKAESN